MKIQQFGPAALLFWIVSAHRMVVLLTIVDANNDWNVPEVVMVAVELTVERLTMAPEKAGAGLKLLCWASALTQEMASRIKASILRMIDIFLLAAI